MPPPPNILIVEDERILAENIKEFLGRRVPNVRLVSSGEGAVEMLEHFSPDAVLMDYHLPGMNGLDTYNAMQQRNPKKIECIMMTGDPADDLPQTAISRGVRSVLAKPFSFAELLESLEFPLPEPIREAGKKVDLSEEENKK